ncbi:MAG TPA: globin [Solirubrobacteraceae bacterium]|jgi:hemoglobin|nr:globin [Solirubrobacteraceae bacterium]
MPAHPAASHAQSLYDAVGGEPTFHRIVARFYELVALDEVLRALYPEADLGAAEERLRLYLAEHWGGPAAYTQLRGAARLAARHMPFRIARVHRDAWLRAMGTALDEAGLAPEHRDRIWGHLETVASNLTTHDTPSTLRLR